LVIAAYAVLIRIRRMASVRHSNITPRSVFIRLRSRQRKDPLIGSFQFFGILTTLAPFIVIAGGSKGWS